jgi:predicted CxxxxCH...CXXCH cytochrome family protein
VKRGSLGVIIAAVAASAFVVTLSMPGCGEVPTEETIQLGQGGAGKFTSFLPAGDACVPTGAHGKHGTYTCATCHYCAGTVSFDPTGLAVNPGGPAPVFDATAKTCSNVKCHSVPAGTFSYYFPDGDGNPVLNTVSYGGTGGGSTPSWYIPPGTGGCGTCHQNPPTYNGQKYVWHSGYHGNQGPTGAYNQCQLCHSDAVSTNGVATGLSTGNCNPTTLQPVTGTPPGSVPCSTFHANGTMNVTAAFKTACFGCH